MMKTAPKTIALLLVMLLGSLNSGAQILEPVKWSFSKEKVSDNVYDLLITATVEKGWSFYAQDIPAGGPVATSFVFEPSTGYKLIGKTIQPKAKTKYDPNFEMELSMFSDKTTFKQRVELTGDKDVTIKGYVEFMCCNDKSCLPPTEASFTYKLPVVKKAQEAQVAPVEAEKTEVATADSLPAKTDSIAVPAAETQPQEANAEENSIAEETNLWKIFVTGFLGGLLALLTPCVFPMIPLTVSFFLRSSGSRRKAIRNASFYGLSIIFFYVLLGVGISLIFGADRLNAAATSPGFNIFFFLLLLVFAFSFLGAYELQLPQKWVNKTDQKAEEAGGLLGVFLMGLTLVLVSFSCTGPIVGTLLVQVSSTGEALAPTIGMLGFSLAVAIPFALFAMFPSALKSLPKSGGWMNIIKVVLGMLVLAFSLKFLTVADSVAQWGILSRETSISLWIAICLILGLYLLGLIRFYENDKTMEKLSLPRFIMALTVFAFMFYLIPGLWGAPLKAVSSFLPPATTQDFDLTRQSMVSAASPSNDLYIGKSVKDGPYGTKAFTDYKEGLEAAKKAGKPVFLDFTGLGCANCHKMEAAIWSDAEVQNLLKNNFVIISLFVDDRTSLPEEEQFISTTGGRERKIRTIGQKWSDFQASKYGVNTQPYHLILDHQENVISGPMAFTTDLKAYIEFLKKGSDSFKK